MVAVVESATTNELACTCDTWDASTAAITCDLFRITADTLTRETGTMIIDSDAATSNQ
jgi:hypothetical protein